MSDSYQQHIFDKRHLEIGKVYTFEVHSTYRCSPNTSIYGCVVVKSNF